MMGRSVISLQVVRTVLLASVVFAATADAQPIVLSDTVPVAGQAASAGLSERGLRAAEAIRQRVAALRRQGGAFDAKTGLYLSRAGHNITSLKVPVGEAGDFVVSTEVIERLGTRSDANRWKILAGIGGPSKEQRLTIIGALKTINPAVLDNAPLTGTYFTEAVRNGWINTSVTPASPMCSKMQQVFTAEVEVAIQNRADIYAWPGTEAKRARWLKAIEGFEAACFEKVPLTGPEAALRPLDRLAVLSRSNGAAYCMALHLGGDRFVTARHCYYEQNGKIDPELANATLSMVTGLDVFKSFVPVKEEPYGLADKFSSSRDLLLIRVPTLSAAVKARPGQTAFTRATTAERALAIGYFPLANPAKSLSPGYGARGEAPDWASALRMTKIDGIDYCRAWTTSVPAADGAACVEHSCQTTGGFSGTPIFVNRGSETQPDWQVIGLNVDDARAKSTASQCGTFPGHEGTGLLRTNGAVAAVVPRRLYTAQIAALIQSGAKP